MIFQSLGKVIIQMDRPKKWFMTFSKLKEHCETRAFKKSCGRVFWSPERNQKQKKTSVKLEKLAYAVSPWSKHTKCLSYNIIKINITS